MRPGTIYSVCVYVNTYRTGVIISKAIAGRKRGHYRTRDPAENIIGL